MPSQWFWLTGRWNVPVVSDCPYPAECIPPKVVGISARFLPEPVVNHGLSFVPFPFWKSKKEIKTVGTGVRMEQTTHKATRKSPPVSSSSAAGQTSFGGASSSDGFSIRSSNQSKRLFRIRRH